MTSAASSLKPDASSHPPGGTGAGPHAGGGLGCDRHARGRRPRADGQRAVLGDRRLRSLWVGNNGDRTVSRVDPATNKVTATIGVGAGPCGVAIGAGAVWVNGYGTDSVIHVNPTTQKVVKRIHRPDQIWDVTFGAGSVWATETNLGYVNRINPKLNKVRHRIRIPGSGGPANLRYAAGAVWVGTQVGRKIYRIDARTNRVTSIRVGSGPRGLAATSTATGSRTAFRTRSRGSTRAHARWSPRSTSGVSPKTRPWPTTAPSSCRTSGMTPSRESTRRRTT